MVERDVLLIIQIVQMTINHIVKAVNIRTGRFFRRIFNTILYFVTPKKDILIVNCAFKQLGSYVIKFNLGDDINYDIFEYLSGKKLILNYREFYHNKLPNIVGIGSIVDWMSNSESIIWGSGVMDSTAKMKVKPSRVLAVRGKLTRDYLLQNGINCPEIYGDPASLLPLLYTPKYPLSKNKKIGIIPHYKDMNNEIINEFIRCYSNAVIIDIQRYRNWRDFVDKVCECECILSSSLHGLIISDSYQIPNIWIKLSENISGNGIKFSDYFSSIDRDSQCYNVNTIKDIVDIIESGLFYQASKRDYTDLVNSLRNYLIAN